MIGICIKYFHENYGGMLQAYATTKIFEEKKIDYELIRYVKHDDILTKIRYIPRLLNSVLLNDKLEAIKKKKGMKKHPDFCANDNIRMQAFNQFREKNFTKLSDEYVGYKELCKGAQKYNAVISGSDQLWSPAGLPTNYYNLMFVPDNIKKISYASSFGVKKIPFYQLGRTKKYLKRIDCISMRENRGSEIVEELVNRTVPTVLDPVFMLSREQWNTYIPQKSMNKEKYIFAYFLGSNPKHREEVKQLSLVTGLKTIALRHMDQYVEVDESFGDFAPYDVGPEEFLNYIREAEYVCTDSFHGSVFSIIYGKKFMVFNRYDENSKCSKNSRIDTLCENLGLVARRYNGNVLRIKEEINYEEVYSKLEVLKAEADNYIEKSLEGIL